MTVGELKKMLNDVPDDYTIGYSRTHTVSENFYGQSTHTTFYDANLNLRTDLIRKQLSLFTL